MHYYGAEGRPERLGYPDFFHLDFMSPHFYIGIVQTSNFPPLQKVPSVGRGMFAT